MTWHYAGEGDRHALLRGAVTRRDALTFWNVKGAEMDSDGKGLHLLNKLIDIELRQVHELGALIADRVDQDATGIEVDSRTGEVLGLLSDAARAARYAIAQRIIKKGGEDPGWGR